MLLASPNNCIKQTIIKKQILSKIEEKDLEKSVGEINNESNRNSELNLF